MREKGILQVRERMVTSVSTMVKAKVTTEAWMMARVSTRG